MIRFPVSPIAPAREPMPTLDVDAVLRDQGILAPEARPRLPHPLAAAQAGHGLLMAVHHAFSEHRPLVLAPDHVWLCVAQGLARWVEAHAERLRGRLVRHPGRLPLEVRRDDFVAGGDNDWPGAVAELCAEMRAHLGGRANLFVADFSTTDDLARAASHVALMAGMQRYFTYSVGTLCGIPEITLEGTPEDWAAIRRRVDVLDELDLADWAERLRPVCDRLIATARGEVDTAWWQDLYKRHSASGGELISGWVNVLFPFQGDEGLERNPAVFDPDYEVASAFGPMLHDYPSGLGQAPFTWDYYGDRRAMSVVGGFLGVAQLDDGRLRPQPGWAVVREVSARRFAISAGPRGAPRLHPRDPAGLRRLDGIADEVAGIERYSLSLSFCRQLESLDGLEALTGLEHLSLVENSHVTDLDALRGLPNLREIHVTQCPNLRDVRALRTLPMLRSLVLQRCPVDDPATLAALDRLTYLSLHLESLPADLCRSHGDADDVRAARDALRRLAGTD